MPVALLSPMFARVCHQALAASVRDHCFCYPCITSPGVLRTPGEENQGGGRASAPTLYDLKELRWRRVGAACPRPGRSSLLQNLDAHSKGDILAFRFLIHFILARL